jgi:arginine:ornithine antiporter/lysine permease
VRSLFDQVTDTMLVTTFVFLGVEGASMYSRFARRREDVGRATLLGFLSVLVIFACEFLRQGRTAAAEGGG